MTETRPATAANKPAATETRPATAANKRAAAETRPATAANKRAAAETRPATAANKRAAAETRPATTVTRSVATTAEGVLTSSPSMRAFVRSTMAVAAGLHPNARRLAHPAVRAKTFDVIGKRVPSADADDIAQSAYVRLMMMPSLPEADDDLRALLVTVVRGLIVDHHRKRKVREDRRDDAADVDEIAFEADDASAQMRERWRQALEFIEREVAAGRVPADILRWAKRLAAGDTYAQIAADEALPESTVKTRMRRAREHLRKRWPLYASAAGGVAIFVLVIRSQEPVTVGRGRPSESERPSVTAPPQSPRAQDYRQRAARECGAGEFDTCERELDEAKKLDTGGETLPEVQAMRVGIQRAKAAVEDGGRR